MEILEPACLYVCLSLSSLLFVARRPLISHLLGRRFSARAHSGPEAQSSGLYAPQRARPDSARWCVRATVEVKGKAAERRRVVVPYLPEATRPSSELLVCCIFVLITHPKDHAVYVYVYIYICMCT